MPALICMYEQQHYLIQVEYVLTMLHINTISIQCTSSQQASKQTYSLSAKRETKTVLHIPAHTLINFSVAVFCSTNDSHCAPMSVTGV